MPGFPSHATVGRFCFIPVQLIIRQRHAIDTIDTTDTGAKSCQYIHETHDTYTYTCICCSLGVQDGFTSRLDLLDLPWTSRRKRKDLHLALLGNADAAQQTIDGADLAFFAAKLLRGVA